LAGTIVIEVGGPKTISQSFKAVRQNGVITVIGFLAGQTKEMPSFLEVLLHTCVVRGILVGSRKQFEDMNRAIDATGIKPVVDEKVFGLEELRDAYQYMVSPLHLEMILVNVC
jgi:NADPH:quinone reductase-like Zn-dependent oxidoreductase